MFEELNSLNYKDFVTVCHEIFAHWNNEIAYSSPKNLSEIVFNFLSKYSGNEHKEALVDYVKERTLHESSLVPTKAGQEFLQNILPLPSSPLS